MRKIETENRMKEKNVYEFWQIPPVHNFLWQVHPLETPLPMESFPVKKKKKTGENTSSHPKIYACLPMTNTMRKQWAIFFNL